MKTLRLLIVATVLLFSHLFVKAADGHLYSSTQLSSSRINCIVQDRMGYIWIGTEYGLNKFDGYHFTSYLYQSNNPHSLIHNNIQSLLVDSQGRLWVGTGKGLARYDDTTDDFCRYDLRPDSDNEPCVAQMTEDRNGRILVGTSGFGLFEITQQADTAIQTHRYSADDLDDYYPAIFFDTQGRFWKVDNTGVVSCFSADSQKPRLLMRRSTDAGQVVRILQQTEGDILVICRKGGFAFRKNDLSPTSIDIGNATLYAAAIDSAGCLLLGSSGNGLYRYDYKTQQRGQMRVGSRHIDFTTAYVTAIYQDNQRNLWVGCRQRGLFFIGNRQQEFDTWSLTAQNVKTGSVVSSICGTGDGSTWASLQDGSLYLFSHKGQILRTTAAPVGLHFIYRDVNGHYWLGAGQNLYRFDPATGKATLSKTFESEYLQCMVDDGQGRLFLSTFSKGLTIYDPNTKTEHHYSMYQTQAPRGFLCNDWILALHYDRQGLLWAATSSGVSCYDPIRDSFRTFGWHNLLEGYTCLSLNEDNDGNMLIGTDRGLFRFIRQANRIEPFPSSNALSDKVINSIECEDNGDIWCSTAMGIWHYRQADSTLLHHLNDGGLREREYMQGVGMHTTDGRIIFATSDGLVAFHPDYIVNEGRRPAAPVLTRMQVNGKQVSLSKAFMLSHVDNNFSMEFSNFDYASVANIQLEYRLNNGPWTQTAIGDNSITFHRLQSGTYSLSVRTVENGIASEAETYTVVIRAPWYRTIWAYLIYLLLLAVITGYVGLTYYRHKRQQLAEEKMQFLINATHDIRTPLTLIPSPLHQLMKRKSNDAETTEKLGIIDHNAHRILMLVNQILDIRKIDKQQMHLHTQKTQLVSFINNIYKVFEAHACEHGITFLFEHDDSVVAWIDHMQFDKVVQNLLSNAFKFTSDGGDIILRLNQDGENGFRLSVTDTGTGISEADLPRIFTRFYQSPVNSALGKEGTGIGLNLCKMIVEMHHGTITAANRTDGRQGSVFTVAIPNIEHSDETKEVEDNITQTSTLKAQSKPGPGRTGYHILLVDDDAEITDYISNELSDFYHFSICHNGMKALSCLLSKDQHYDLVVSDILMPEMDGFTLLRAIKSNLSIAHLPVILLTTEANARNRLKGLQHGADAFMPKPFIVDELRKQIDNLLAKSLQLKQKFSGAIDEQTEKLEQRDVDDTDQQLMTRIVQSVNKNLSDGDFSVEQLASEVGLSRSHLHRRMKELTGLSASDFIRNIRLEQAARLLRERKANISQVAYSVGFNSPGTFSKVFRQHFGQSPTEYAAQDE